MIPKQVYSNWAFQDNAEIKAKINREIYEEIKDKAKVEWVGSGYGHKKYKGISNPHNLSYDELALICDRGNLCFGYRLKGSLIVIYTD